MNIRLRNVETGDLPALFEHQTDPEANRMAAVIPRDLEAFHAHWAKILQDRRVVAKAILVDDAVGVQPYSLGGGWLLPEPLPRPLPEAGREEKPWLKAPPRFGEGSCDEKDARHPQEIWLHPAVVGSVNFFQAEGKNAVGYWISKEHWGRGIASRALALLLEEITIRPLHAWVARENAASIRVLERCGFTIVGSRDSPGDSRYLPCVELIYRLE